MIRRPPRSTRTDTLLPDTTLFRSSSVVYRGAVPPGTQIEAVRPASLVCGLHRSGGETEPVGLGRLERAGRKKGFRGMDHARLARSEEHTSELQSLMRNSYAVFCLQNKNNKHKNTFNLSADRL